MVLLRGADPRGFVFHTNYNSRKARDLTENAHAALCLHWPTLEEQIRIEGSVVRLPADESDAYFAGRPRESQLGAWASEQSAVLPDRSVLEERVRSVEAEFDGQPVPRPPFWGGFRIVPDRIEFWYGGTARLHDRIVYLREGSGLAYRAIVPVSCGRHHSLDRQSSLTRDRETRDQKGCIRSPRVDLPSEKRWSVRISAPSLYVLLRNQKNTGTPAPSSAAPRPALTGSARTTLATTAAATRQKAIGTIG